MRFVHCGRKEFLERTRDRKLVLIGASVQPYEAEKNLREEFGAELSERVDRIVDNDPEKQGKEFPFGGGFVIQNAGALRAVDWAGHAVLITSRCYLEIVRQLEQMPELADAEVYAWACMVLDMELTPDGKLERRIYGEAMLQYGFWLSCARCGAAEKERLRRAMKEKISAPGFRVLPRVTVMHSNICSLRCEHCCDLIPQVKKPYYVPAEEIIANLKLLLTGVDLCMDLDLTDGEGLLYKELDKVLEFALGEEKFATVLLMSNGTVMPKPSTLELMKHPKFRMSFSDYGLGEKLGRVCSALEENGVNYEVNHDLIWKDFGVTHIEKRKEGREFLRYDFLRCRNKLCSKALFGRRLYACMPAFRMANLGIYESPRDYVEFDGADTPDEVWEKLYHLCMIGYIDACDYCNFENTGVSVIPVGS